MITTAEKVWLARTVINKMLNAGAYTDDPRVGFRAMKTLRAVANELEQIDEYRINLVRKYGDQVDENQIVVPQEKKEQFDEDFIRFMETEIEFDQPPLPIEVIKNIEISYQEMMLISWLLEE